MGVLISGFFFSIAAGIADCGCSFSISSYNICRSSSRIITPSNGPIQHFNFIIYELSMANTSHSRALANKQVPEYGSLSEP
ncbi:hypothetical protein SAMN05660816_01078 [Niastella yeongjuensis]|nr:hypothetical protein SAMN05660816_01078 [Niastella yeongjuensis]